MTHSPDRPLSHAQAAFYAPMPFDVLDSCHQEILAMLEDLHTLIEHVSAQGVDASARTLARSIHLFFTTTGLPHHLDEEQHVFPILLKSGDPDMARTIEHLRHDHVEIESLWLSLVPHLDMMARGYNHPHLGELRSLAHRFTSLCRQHIEEEERLIYPRAKANQSSQDLHVMRREMAERRDGLLNPGEEKAP
ncbi:MAG: hemerythrin domain-containing protein [Aquabacterium sp.]|uniref:hemerythrin domain-containing protein n=1 Tax=Aquabacterium sp. TaxID=1872578 RepID=UPI0027259B60|nr:hemerythrin domain-containing protein [Aquabacterium sp.]MDO9003376.1 hemerythrin domain-containing protein [Aquabacterium sp.]